MKIKNIGKVSEQWLIEIGIKSYEDLKKIGSIEAYKRIKTNHPLSVNLVLLYALEAGIRNINWLKLSREEREELAEMIEQAKLVSKKRK